MNFIYSKDKNFASLWNIFVSEDKNISWRYLWKWQLYQQSYCKNTLLKDLSFIALENSIPVAICPLFLEEDKKLKQFSQSLGYQPVFLIKRNLNVKFKLKIEKLLQSHIDSLANKYQAGKILAMYDNYSDDWKYNHLTKYGYLESSISTAIIDLTQDEKIIWSNLRSSYQSCINQAKRNYQIKIYDFSNYYAEVHELYCRLHHLASGRITRPETTFNLQSQMLKENNAILIGLKHHEKFVAFSYFFHHGNNAYYASSSDDPNHKHKIPFEHIIIWEAIQYYKSRGLEILEIGWQHFGEQFLDHPSEKDKQLSFFRRGFGNNLISLYRGVKYYDRALLSEDLDHNILILKQQYLHEF